MVLKTCKPGYAGLNTGRTLRGSGRLPGRHYAFIRCSEAGDDAPEEANAAAVRQSAAAAVTHVADSIERSQLDFSLRDLSIELPPDGVEYSLNKKSRWETAERIRDELQTLAEEADCEVQLFEHHLRPRWGTSGSRACTAFYSSGGVGKSPKSKSAAGQRYMNAGSLAKEQKGGKSRKRRSQRNRRRSTEQNDAESGGGDEAAKFSEAQVAENRRRLALACDLVRSVPSGSSAIYAARQGQAKRQKLAGRYCRKANDVADMVSDYLCDNFSYDDLVYSDDESIADDSSQCQPSSGSSHPIVTVSTAFDDWHTGAVALPAAIHTAHTADVLSEVGQVSSHKGHICCSKSEFSTVAPATEAGASSDPKRSTYVRLVVVQLGGKEMRVLHIKDAKRTSSRRKSNRRRKQRMLEGSKYSMADTNAVAAVRSLAVEPSSVAPVTLRILPRDDGSGVMEQLSSAFGELYSDCRCLPRMCAVELRDISRKVSLACRCRPKHSELIAHLVVQEGSRQSDTYNVWLSSNLQCDQTLVGTLGTAEAHTLEELLENVEAYLLSLPHECFATKPLASSIHHGTAPSRAITALYDTRRWSVACQTLDDVQQEVAAFIAKLEEENERNAKDSQENLVLIPVVAQRSLSTRQNQCGACFEEIGPERAVKGAALTQCGHSFCFGCWRAYLSGKVTEGQSVLQCPEYRCPAVVDFATVLAICGPDVARRHRMKEAEVIVWKEGNVAWCPNPWCKRLVRVKCERPKAAGRGEAASVSCLCGRSFCFSCSNEPHWPLTCEQAARYHSLLKREGLFTSEQLLSTSVLVRTKPCPGCHYPIEKWLGCDHVACVRCSVHFCWRCLGVTPASNGYQHVTPCQVPVDTDLKEHELGSMADRWSGRRSSLLAYKAVESRRRKASNTARRLGCQLVAMLARAEFQTMKEFAEFIAYSAPSADSTSLTNRVAAHLLRSVVAFKLDAHRIEEYSLACLAMGPRRFSHRNASEPVATDAWKGTANAAAASSGISAADISRRTTRKRAVAELTRLSFVLEQLEALLLSLSSADSAKPTISDLRRLHGLSATGERSVRSVVTLLAAFQGF